MSVLSAISPAGELFTRVQTPLIHGRDWVRFRRRLPGRLGPKLVAIWDGSPIHRWPEVAWFLSDATPGSIPVEQVPGSAPALNPDEGVWEDLKEVELRNCCGPGLGPRYCALIRAIARLRHKGVIQD